MTIHAAELEQIDTQQALSLTRYCMICREPLSEARSRRPTSTCSEPCKDRMDAQQLEQRRLRKCPHCLHPSTPEEREEFRVWRASRGDVRGLAIVKREAGGAPKHLLRRALREAVGVLVEKRAEILDGCCANTVEGIPERSTLSEVARPGVERLEEQIKRFQKLIDTKGAE